MQSTVFTSILRLFVIGLMVLGYSSAQAQDSDPAAIKLLNQLRDTYASFESVSMDFALAIEDLENKSVETREGTLAIVGDNFRLALEDQVIYCDNESIWTFLPDVCEVQIDDFLPDESEYISPSTLFNIPEDEYFAVMGEGKVLEGRKVQVVELSPLDKELSFYKIKLNVDLQSIRILNAEILDKNGIHFTYRIMNFVGPASLSASDVAFKAPECGDDLIVIDVSR